MEALHSANGGTTGVTAFAGLINIDAAGVGGANVNTNAVLETLDGDGTDQSATNVTID